MTDIIIKPCKCGGTPWRIKIYSHCGILEQNYIICPLCRAKTKPNFLSICAIQEWNKMNNQEK